MANWHLAEQDCGAIAELLLRKNARVVVIADLIHNEHQSVDFRPFQRSLQNAAVAQADVAFVSMRAPSRGATPVEIVLEGGRPAELAQLAEAAKAVYPGAATTVLTGASPVTGTFNPPEHVEKLVAHWGNTPDLLRTRIAAFLQSHPDRDELGATAGEFMDLATNPHGRYLLENWLTDDSAEWVARKVEPLAAIAEAVAAEDIAGAPSFLLQILTTPGMPLLVLSVAAQRARLFAALTPESRDALWSALRPRLEAWMSSESPEHQDAAFMGLPSVAHIAGDRAVDWLGAVVQERAPSAALGAARGVLDWATSSSGSDTPLTGRSADILAAAMVGRLEAESAHAGEPLSDALRATLVWALGAFVPPADVDRFLPLLVQSFKRGRGTEDVAAVKAGQHLVRRLQEAGMARLQRAFEATAPDDRDRFLVAMQELRGK